MKILQLIQKPQLRGAEVFACQLSNHLIAAGHDVKVISLFEGSATLPFAGSITNLKRPLSKRMLDIQGWRMLANEIKAFNPDVIQANAGDTLKFAVLSKIFFRWKAPIIFRNASVISLYIKSGLVKAWNAFLFHFVRKVVSVSEVSRKDFVSLFPSMKNSIEVVGVGIECTPLPVSPEKVQPYIVHVGGFTFEKNHERLLYIFKELLKEQPGLNLYLIGDGHLRPAMESQVRSMELTDRVRFLGHQSQVLPLIQQARALVLPSVIEGLPGVLLEAMYCRTPVVAYDTGGISEIVKSGETGWLIRLGDEKGFAEAVLAILRSSDLHQIKENAYARVVKEFDNRIIAEKFTRVYRSIAN